MAKYPNLTVMAINWAGLRVVWVKIAKSPLLFTQFMANTARLDDFTIKVTLSSVAKVTR